MILNVEIKLYRLFGLFVLLLSGIHSVKGQAVFDLTQMRNKYPGEIGVYIEDRQDVFIDYKGDSIIAKENQKEDMLYLTDQAKEFSEKKIYYSYFIKVNEISAETLVPTDKKYKTVKVTSFKDNKEYSSGIFYDDLMSKSFVFSAVQPGARTILNYSRDISDPRLLSAFYFGAGVPVELSELNITVNKNIKLNYKMFNTDNIVIEHTTKEKGNYFTHTFKALNLKGYPYEADAPSASYYRPHIVYYLEESNFNNKEKPILATVGDLHKWYYTFVKAIVENTDKMDDLRFVVDSLTRGTTTELEKVKKIYYWVQDHISYVAIENGYRGFIPHQAEDTYGKRYGDCKDMATIIYTMLKLAGIESHLTWIGSRDIPYKYSDLPCPAVDDHMITTYIKDDAVYFLDATSKYTAFGQPSSHIQGKEALVSMDKDHYVVKLVPIVKAAQNTIIDTTYLKIDGKLLRVEGSTTMTNYPKIFSAYRLDGLTYKKQKEHLTNFLTRGNNKFLLDTVTIKNLLERDKPLEIDFKGSIGDYFKTIDGEIYINLNLEKLFFNEKIDTTRRKAPKENTYCYKADAVTILTIPAGYQLEELPKNVSRKDELFGFNITYEKKGNTIVCKRSIEVDYLLLEKVKFQEWNKMIDELSSAYRDAVILKTL